MRFGHFFYPMKFDDSRDDEAIHDCLEEAVLVEDLGFDAIWIAEHYFTGECVYGDPLVFASALAVKNPTRHAWVRHTGIAAAQSGTGCNANGPAG